MEVTGSLLGEEFPALIDLIRILILIDYQSISESQSNPSPSFHQHL